ncbi:MAG: response regulator transcription factor [Proteobacteria bacterium]|nr:response regulator transcription factor [Pseudomonadota bacterium]
MTTSPAQFQPPRHVLAVDDHRAAREWIGAAVLAAFPVATLHTAPNARDAIAMLLAQPVDLAVIDIGLPDASGLEVLRVLRQRRPDCLAIIATVFDDDAHLFAALRAGAAGYLLKDQSRESLAESLLGLLQGRPALSAGVARRLVAHFVAVDPPGGSSTAVSAEPIPALTGRERDVLQLVSKGCSVPETAKVLGISAHTAHGYVKDVYRKLAVSSRAEAALAANRLGIV